MNFRCGRTDKGVSAFEQVVSITLRSKLQAGVGIVSEANDEVKGSDGNSAMNSDDEEINYVQLLNKGRILFLHLSFFLWFCQICKYWLPFKTGLRRVLEVITFLSFFHALVIRYK